MNARHAHGYTLVEILTVVAVLGCIAAVLVPALSTVRSSRLDVAAEEAANAVRYAVQEAQHTGGYVLVDAQTVPGHLRVFNANASGLALGPVADPLTRRALDVDVEGSTFSAGVAMAPQFLQGGVAYAQLLIAPAAQMQAYDGVMPRGGLQAGSGIVLRLDSASVVVAIDGLTGRISLP